MENLSRLVLLVARVASPLVNLPKWNTGLVMKGRQEAVRSILVNARIRHKGKENNSKESRVSCTTLGGMLRIPHSRF